VLRKNGVESALRTSYAYEQRKARRNARGLGLGAEWVFRVAQHYAGEPPLHLLPL